MQLTLVSEILEAERDELGCCAKGIAGRRRVALCDILRIMHLVVDTSLASCHIIGYMTRRLRTQLLQPICGFRPTPSCRAVMIFERFSTKRRIVAEDVMLT